MPHAIRMHATGGPDVLVFEEIEVGDPGPGEVRIRQTAIGLNYIDTYHRSGLYPLPLPTSIGSEAAGVVEAVGQGVTWLRKGDRVAYSGGPPGAYATDRVMAADRLVKIPDGIDDTTAATLMLKGMTVQYLFRQTFPLEGRRDHPVPRGGGRRWAHRVPMGARARRHDDRHGRVRRQGGAREGERLRAHHRLHARGFRREDEGADRRQGRARRLRLGRQGHVHAVARLPAAARPARRLRQCVGAGFRIQPRACSRRRARCTSRGRRSSRMRASRAKRSTRWPKDVFDLVLAGKIKSEARQQYPLREAAAAHRALESRVTTGATVLSALAGARSSSARAGVRQLGRGDAERAACLARPAHRRRRRAGTPRSASAVRASSCCASSAPSRPHSTSPLPAVASAGPPLALMSQVPSGMREHAARALQHDVGGEPSRELAACAHAVVLHFLDVDAQEPRRFAGMRRGERRRAARLRGREQRRIARDQVERIGIERERNLQRERAHEQRTRGVAGAEAGTDRPAHRAARRAPRPRGAA